MKMEPKNENFFHEVLKFSVIALLIVAPIRLFVAQPFIVNGASMEPTFETGEYLIVDQLSYRFGPPERGDVVIFRYPEDPSKFFIKRIVGLPNETVRIDGPTVRIENSEHPEGFILEEPYVDKNNFRNDVLETTLSGHEYFVLGDNRRASSDSRVWGALPDNLIVGKAFIRLFPPATIELSPGEFRTN